MKKNKLKFYDVDWDLHLTVRYPAVAVEPEQDEQNKVPCEDIAAYRTVRHIIHLIAKVLPKNATVEVEPKTAKVTLCVKPSSENSVDGNLIQD
jgi:hypothetical protein